MGTYFFGENKMINKINTEYPMPFKGALDGVLTNTLRTLDTNPMANAVGIDLFAMVAPRTYVDTKKRNKHAGAETFFREFTGTLIVCLSASWFAKLISHAANKFINPQTVINPQSWYSNDSLSYLNTKWNKSRNTASYVSGILDDLSGVDGNKIRNFKYADWKNIDWIDEKKWSQFKWDNVKFKDIHKKLKDKNSIISILCELIENKNITSSDSRKLLKIIELRLTNILKADKVTAADNCKSVSASMHNLLRDMVELGRDVFTNDMVSTEKAVSKILKINKVKSIGALAVSSLLGLTNQYINRKITEKRTGKTGFVGDLDYQNRVQKKPVDKSKSFLLQKILASAGMAAMAISVMKIKSPADFLKKLEFTGPVTSGNAIKTVYASTLIGRFLASDNKDELRETVTRDYLGFLNWLVLGGFAAKGTANLLDFKRQNLFNISQKGQGLRHWLYDISLKSHNEIAAQGMDFAKKNMRKLNTAHFAGLAYSTLALGVLLPMLNITVTKNKQKNKISEIPFKPSLKQFLHDAVFHQHVNSL